MTKNSIPRYRGDVAGVLTRISSLQHRITGINEECDSKIESLRAEALRRTSEIEKVSAVRKIAAFIEPGLYVTPPDCRPEIILAIAPAVSGDENDVPLTALYPPSTSGRGINLPGATTSGLTISHIPPGPRDEKLAMLLSPSVAPTESA